MSSPACVRAIVTSPVARVKEPKSAALQAQHFQVIRGVACRIGGPEWNKAELSHVFPAIWPSMGGFPPVYAGAAIVCLSKM